MCSEKFKMGLWKATLPTYERNLSHSSLPWPCWHFGLVLAIQASHGLISLPRGDSPVPWKVLENTACTHARYIYHVYWPVLFIDKRFCKQRVLKCQAFLTSPTSSCCRTLINMHGCHENTLFTSKHWQTKAELKTTKSRYALLCEQNTTLIDWTSTTVQ